MRRRIVISLLSLFVLFAVGGSAASWYVTSATERMQRLLELHRIEGLRRSLVIHVQAVQADFYTARTALARRLDSIVDDVEDMEEAAEECDSCHHRPAIEADIEELHRLIDDYKVALSYYITTSANRDRIASIQMEAAAIGDHIVRHSTEMSAQASLSLDEVARHLSLNMSRLRLLLLITPIGATLLGVVVFLYLVRSVTTPVQRMVGATRVIASGDLGHQIQDEWEGEFGELASHFNMMSAALEKSYQRLKLSNEDLRREIAERRQAEERREELQGLLLQAQKMEALGRLSVGVAHEFNNFLQVIQGCADRLAREEGADRTDDSEIEMINSATGRGAELTRQLLTFASKAEGERLPIDLNDVVRRVKAMAERIFPEGIQIQVGLGEAIHAVMADPAQIEQALLNLALNARDAMPEGGLLRMETDRARGVGTEADPAGSGETVEWVVLRVEDSGCGMDEETVRKIFDPFFTTKGIGVGVGLGLATVYGIVTSHGGQIECRSRPGGGTMFEIRLPALPGASVAPRTERPPAAETQRGSGTILFVDDESAVLRVMRESLEEQGYVVHTAESGEEALESYREHREEIDVVVLDLGMPGMGGRACLKELMKIDPQVRVVISTAYTSRGDEREMMKAGARGFLAKPYRISEMIGQLEALLNS